MNNAILKRVKDLTAQLEALAYAGIVDHDWEVAWQKCINCNSMLTMITEIVRRKAMEAPRD